MPKRRHGMSRTFITFKMNEFQAKSVLQALGVTQIKKASNWVTCSCPLAPWKHKNGKDTNPSFGLSTGPGKPSAYNCFTCGHGSVAKLLQEIDFHYAKDPIGIVDLKLAREILEQEEIEMSHLPPFQEFTPPPHQVFQPLPDFWINSFPSVTYSPDAWAYLRDTRKVALGQIAQFNIRWDPLRSMVVFPYWDVYGRLAGARGRSIYHRKFHDYTYQGINNAGVVWFNEQVLQLPGPVVVVEGQFDCMRVAQRFPKVVAAMTATPAYAKLPKIMQSSMVIHIPDNDEAGRNSIDQVRMACAQYGVTYAVIHLPDTVKDPDDCSPDYLLDRIHELGVS